MKKAIEYPLVIAGILVAVAIVWGIIFALASTRLTLGFTGSERTITYPVSQLVVTEKDNGVIYLRNFSPWVVVLPQGCSDPQVFYLTNTGDQEAAVLPDPSDGLASCLGMSPSLIAFPGQRIPLTEAIPLTEQTATSVAYGYTFAEFPLLKKRLHLVLIPASLFNGD